jgi:tetratricopeptide (TPR) repeat protein
MVWAIVLNLVNLRHSRGWCVCLLTSLMLTATCVVRAQQDVQSPNPNRFVDTGMAYQKWAQEAKTPAEAVENLQKAIELYAQAVKTQPDLYRAQAMWARCLHQLAARVSDPHQRRTLAEAARSRFAQAARCPGVEWTLYHEWGKLLSYEVENLSPDPKQRHLLLAEAKQVFEKALEMTRFSGERATVERDLGMCLLLLAQDSLNPTQQRTLYEQAIAKFESATRVESQSRTPRIYGVWGVALLRLGKLNGDRMMIRQGIERLQTSLEKDPDNVEMRYNLACAYALLDQPENAMRHLRLCLDKDDDRRTYFNAASQDPDLNSLRRTTEYNELFAPRPLTAPNALTQPGLSDR